MPLLNSFLNVLCYEAFIYLFIYYCYGIFISFRLNMLLTLFFFPFDTFQSETDDEPKEEKTRKKHKVEHVDISNSLMLYFKVINIISLWLPAYQLK